MMNHLVARWAPIGHLFQIEEFRFGEAIKLYHMTFDSFTVPPVICVENCLCDEFGPESHKRFLTATGVCCMNITVLRSVP